MMQNTYTPEEPNTQQTEMQEAAPSKKTAKRRRHKHDYQYWLAEPYNTARGEMALWVAVITQAMMDALSNSRNPETIACKQAAIAWLTGNSKDFCTVCHFAGMDPDYVRKKAKKSITSPIPWRAEAGKGSRYAERKAYRQKIKMRSEQKLNELDTPEHIVITGFWDKGE